MRGPKATPIALTERQRALLERLARRHTSPQRVVRRSRVVLAAALGRATDQLADQLGLDRGTVQCWRGRWHAAAGARAAAEGAGDDDAALTRRIADALADAPRPGTRPTFAAAQVVQIVALACEPPPASDRPISHWTPRALADEAVSRGIVTAISPRSVERFGNCSGTRFRMGKGCARTPNGRNRLKTGG